MLGLGLEPHMLISLTAPKLCARFFAGVHYVGGRFVTPGLAAKYGIVLPKYKGCDQFVRLFLFAFAYSLSRSRHNHTICFTRQP